MPSAAGIGEACLVVADLGRHPGAEMGAQAFERLFLELASVSVLPILTSTHRPKAGSLPDVDVIRSVGG
jgi:hypothetical protein